MAAGTEHRSHLVLFEHYKRARILSQVHHFLIRMPGLHRRLWAILSAWDWLHGMIPWWNPYTGIGVPLAGELQPGAFFLPFNLLLLLKEGLLWQRIAMQIIAGLGDLCALARARTQPACGTSRWRPVCAEWRDCLDPRTCGCVLLVAFSSMVVMGH